MSRSEVLFDALILYLTIIVLAWVTTGCHQIPNPIAPDPILDDPPAWYQCPPSAGSCYFARQPR